VFVAAFTIFVDTFIHTAFVVSVPLVLDRRLGLSATIIALPAFGYYAGALVGSALAGVISYARESDGRPRWNHSKPFAYSVIALAAGVGLVMGAGLLLDVSTSDPTLVVALIITGRLLEGVGSGVIMVLSFSLVNDVYASDELVRALSIVYSAFAVGDLAAAPLSSVLYGSAGLSAVCLVLLAAALADALCRFLLIDERFLIDSRRRLYRLQQQHANAPPAADPQERAGFFQVLRTTFRSYSELLSHRAVVVFSLVGLLGNIIICGYVLLIPLYLIDELRVSSDKLGALMIPGIVGMFLGSYTAAPLIKAFGVRASQLLATACSGLFLLPMCFTLPPSNYFHSNTAASAAVTESSALPVLLVFNFLIGISANSAITVSLADTSRWVDAQRRHGDQDAVYSLNSLSWCIAGLLGPLPVGVMYSYGGILGSVLLLNAGVVATCALVLADLFLTRKQALKAGDAAAVAKAAAATAAAAAYGAQASADALEEASPLLGDAVDVDTAVLETDAADSPYASDGEQYV
jgi:MFS family permease